MKRLLLLCATCLALTASCAAPKHYFYFLTGQSNVNVEFDYKQVRFDTPMNASELDNFRKAHQATWENIFIRELNEELEDVRIVAQQNTPANYTIQVTPTKATKHGFLRATVTFLDKEGTVLKTLDIRGEKERNRGLTESYMHSMKELGEELGDIIDDGI